MTRNDLEQTGQTELEHMIDGRILMHLLAESAPAGTA